MSIPRTAVKSSKRAPASTARLSHVGSSGEVRMVDVSDKPVTTREAVARGRVTTARAVARGRVTMSRKAITQIQSGAVKKGDPLQTARLAAIMAAKQAANVIRLG